MFWKWKYTQHEKAEEEKEEISFSKIVQQQPVEDDPEVKALLDKYKLFG
jgi:hypothetical protein